MAIVISPSGRKVVQRRSTPQAKGYPFAPGGQQGSLADWSVSGAVSLTGGKTATYMRIYRSQPWVYIAVNKIAKSFANLPLHVFTQDGDGRRQRVRPGRTPAGTLAGLIERPQPYVSEYDWKFSIAAELFVHGHYFAVKTTPDGTPVRGTDALPTELWSVPWSMVTVVEGKRQPVESYVVEVDGKKYPFIPDEVVHLELWQGISPLEPLRQTLAIEDATMRETRAAFENGLRPNGAWTTPGRMPSQQDRDAIRAELERSHGGVDQAYKTAILGGGLTWDSATFNHQEVELIPIRKLSREEVAAALDIPPPMIGILDHATYSNFDQAHRSFYMESIAPFAVKVEEGLEVQLMDPEPEWRELDIEFSMDEVMKADLPARAEAYTKLTRVGFTVDEIRHLENKPPFDFPMTTTAYVPQELMPTDPEAITAWMEAQASKSPAPPEKPEQDENVTALIAASIARLTEPQQMQLPTNVEVQTPPVNVFTRDVTPKEMERAMASMPPPVANTDKFVNVMQAAMEQSNAAADRRHAELVELNARLLAEMSRPRRKHVVRDPDTDLIADVIEFPHQEEEAV